MRRKKPLELAIKQLQALGTREVLFVLASVALVVSIIVYGSMHSRVMINPTAYAPLLDVIATGESRGNYKAYYGNVANNTTDITGMTVNEVLEWQTNYVAQGSPSSAVGRYQIIQPTLLGLVDELELNGNEQFNEALQDRLAIALLERRGSIDFIKGDLTHQTFAHNLSKEWAALPRIIGDNPEASYYAGDGLNESHISSAEITAAIGQFKQFASTK